MTQVQQPATVTNTNGQVAKTHQHTIVDQTLTRIVELQQTGGLQIPKDYSASNALRAAWLILQDVKDMNKNPVLQSCTKESIANALLKMVVQGLNPVKRQCSFVAYGATLTCQREYQGSIAVAKRYGLKSVVANPIFAGDEFAFEVDTETGRKKITKHVSTFDSYGGQVKGAYAIVEMDDGSKNVEIMNMNQIQAAWNQGPTKGQSPAHKNFPDQMACKTVINRAVKGIINSSDDADLFEEDAVAVTETPVSAYVKHEITEHANGVNGQAAIGFDDNDDTASVVNNDQQSDQHGTEATPAESVAIPNDQPNLFNQPVQNAKPRRATF